jgi:hypothetical protein
MQRQLTWWSTNDPPAAGQAIWEHLDQLDQMRAMAALAKLIGKVMEPQSNTRCEEDDHEQ